MLLSCHRAWSGMQIYGARQAGAVGRGTEVVNGASSHSARTKAYLNDIRHKYTTGYYQGQKFSQIPSRLGHLYI